MGVGGGGAEQPEKDHFLEFAPSPLQFMDSFAWDFFVPDKVYLETAASTCENFWCDPGPGGRHPVIYLVIAGTYIDSCSVYG